MTSGGLRATDESWTVSTLTSCAEVALCIGLGLRRQVWVSDVDIKPDNLLVIRVGFNMLVDFGRAAFLGYSGCWSGRRLAPHS